MNPRIPLVIDTDTAADDCFALLVGLLDPRADLLAVTMVAGNVGFDQQVHNALLTLELAGRLGEVPVHLGAREPLEREWRSASEVHGDGVGGLRRAETGHTTSDEHAADALVRLVREHRGELTIVAIGPLTNIALAVQRDPEFAANVGRLTVMGGSINGRGNITPAAEFNIYVDPEAAQIVFDAGFADLVVVPWDPTTLRDLVFDADAVARIAAQDTVLSRFFVRANQATFDFDLGAGLAGSTHPDSLSVLVSLDPTFAVSTGRYRVDVETVGELTRGATVFDWKPDAVPNALAIEAVDASRFFSYLSELLASEPTGAVVPEALA
ncbi:nucleoside hydrolase [Amnibacterium flavum]|uniref:Nucleoside hydrolase n=1 Tax=Amnibacterium flavum TaxID=2173173 RepID=A0A2V1HLE8_9MICO|nr:nucleoside hydrolase [Amnibacterium flavum]PVZ93476.1 nucleoside hydrolase [Amnibacterium flavum]